MVCSLNADEITLRERHAQAREFFPGMRKAEITEVLRNGHGPLPTGATRTENQSGKPQCLSEIPHPESQRRCEKIENARNPLSQVLDYQRVQSRVFGFSAIFSHLQRDSIIQPRVASMRATLGKFPNDDQPQRGCIFQLIFAQFEFPKGIGAKAGYFIAAQADDGKTVVPQVSKPAVSPISKSAGRRNCATFAGLETRDTADLEVCGTGLTMKYPGKRWQCRDLPLGRGSVTRRNAQTPRRFHLVSSAF